MALSIDQFIVQTGKSAKGKVVPERVQGLNRILDSLGMNDLSYEFTGISDSVKHSVGGKNSAISSSVAIVDSEAYKKAGLGELNVAHFAPLDSTKRAEAHMKFLKKQGIKFNEGLRGVIYMSPESIMSTANTHGVIATHEIGHSMSTFSGARAELDKSRKGFFKSLNVGEMAPNVEDLKKMSSSYLDVMAGHGLEEGRAQSFAYEALSDRLSRSVPTEDLNKIVQSSISSYISPSGFKRYSSHYDDHIKNFLQKSGSEIEKIEGPISGKIGLTSEQFFDELTTLGRTKGYLGYVGTLKNISGTVGEVTGEIADQSLKQVTESLGGSKIGREYGESGIAKLKDIISTDIQKYKGRSVSISKRFNAEKPIAKSVEISGQAIAAFDDLPDTQSVKIGSKIKGNDFVPKLMYGRNPAANPDLIVGGGEHMVQAIHPQTGELVGKMTWWEKTAFNPGEIDKIDVAENYRRMGIGTSMLNKAKELSEIDDNIPFPVHSAMRTEMGEAWARSTGDILPKRIAEQALPKRIGEQAEVAARVSSTAVSQTVEEGVEKVVRNSGATGRLLGAATEASAAVAGGTANSGALRAAGAALNILKSRL